MKNQFLVKIAFVASIPCSLFFSLTTYASDYPALDYLKSSESFTNAGWFNCGLKPTPNPSSGTLQLKVVSVRGEGSCTSTDVYSLSCEKYKNKCSRGSTPFYACTNGDFVFGDRYAVGFFYGDMIAPCDPVPDQVAALVDLRFADESGTQTDYLLPGKASKLVLNIKNETSEVLSDYTATITSNGGASITLAGDGVDFGEIAARQYATPKSNIAISATDDSCGKMFSLTFTITKTGRKRQFVRHFSVGKPQFSASVIRAPGQPIKLKSDGTTTITMPAVGATWPYDAKVFKASYRSRITHELLGDISSVAIQSPGASTVSVFRGDGKRKGSQSNSGDITSQLQGKNGWGDWILTSSEKDYRQQGVMDSFEIEAGPAVFSCQL